jgi:hypothetical protein
MSEELGTQIKPGWESTGKYAFNKEVLPRDKREKHFISM